MPVFAYAVGVLLVEIGAGTAVRKQGRSPLTA